MKIAIPFLILIFAFSVSAQTATQVLAKANGQNFTAADLPKELREAFLNQTRNVLTLRKSLFNELIAEMLLEFEAKTQRLAVDKLLQTNVYSKVPNPTEKQIQEVYDANRSSLAGKSLEQVRRQIIAFLRREPEQKALGVYIQALAKKYKLAVFKDINARNLKASDILASANGRNLSVANFDAKSRVIIYEYRTEIFDDVRDALEEKIYFLLVEVEAKAENIQSNELIAREISNKLRDYSDEESEQLKSGFRKKLFTKYNVQFFLKEPIPLVLPVSADDDPAKGAVNAPITVVMFSDFQCTACAAVHPVLKRVLSEFPPEKVRFVVRDFPLETIHENAFQAALAANAAFKQGKFFEYIEILYGNQYSLDRESLKRYAAEIGLNTAQFEADFQNEQNAAEIRKDLKDGENYGVSGTPTIFVNGIKVRRNTAENFRNAINKALGVKP